MAGSVRQAARVEARKAQAEKRKERQELDRRRSALGVDISVALSERDAAVERFEQLAARSMTELVEGTGVTRSQVPDWVPGLSAAEVKRLLQLGPHVDGVTGE